MKNSKIIIKKVKEIAVQIIDGDRGKNYPKESDFMDDGYCLFLNAGNVTDKGFSFNNCQFISFDKDQVLRKGKLKKYDLVMTTRGTLGNIAYFNNRISFRNIRINSGMLIFRADSNKILPSYFYYNLNSPYFYKQVEMLKTGVAQPQLPIRDIKNIKIFLHQLDEQKKIASILSKYDDLIDINQKRIQLLEEAARLLYREWFVYFRFPGHENVKIVDGIPEGWEITKIKSIGEVITGKTPSKKKPENFDGETPFIKTPDMHKASIILSTEETLSEIGTSLQKNKTLPPWSILVSCIGSVGVVSMNLYKSQTNQQINSIIPKNRYFRYYLYFCLSRMKPLLEAIGGGSTMANINKSKFENLKIIKPTENLLVEFYKIAKPIFKEIAVLLEQNQKLAQARDLLLPRLMSGKIDVSEFDNYNIPLESEVEKIVN